MKNKNLGAHILLKLFFGNFNFKTTFLLQSGPIFDKAAKLGKATRDADNWGGYLSNFVSSFEKLDCR